MGYILCVRSWDHVCTRGINTQDFFEKKIFLEKKLRTRTKAKIGKVKKIRKVMVVLRVVQVVIESTYNKK